MPFVFPIEKLAQDRVAIGLAQGCRLGYFDTSLDRQLEESQQGNVLELFRLPVDISQSVFGPPRSVVAIHPIRNAMVALFQGDQPGNRDHLPIFWPVCRAITTVGGMKTDGVRQIPGDHPLESPALKEVRHLLSKLRK